MSCKESYIFVEDLELKYIVAEYTDKSGSRENIPIIGDILVSGDNRYKIMEHPVTITKYADGGKTPFVVKVKLCRIK